MTLEIIEVWNGENYLSIIRALNSVNQELTIKVVGKRLIVRDDEAGFYECIPLGDVVKVPKRECEPDEIIEPIQQRINQSIHGTASTKPSVWSRGGVWGDDYQPNAPTSSEVCS